jgi:hypothetical protein
MQESVTCENRTFLARFCCAEKRPQVAAGKQSAVIWLTRFKLQCGYETDSAFAKMAKV